MCRYAIRLLKSRNVHSLDHATTAKKILNFTFLSQAIRKKKPKKTNMLRKRTSKSMREKREREGCWIYHIVYYQQSKSQTKAPRHIIVLASANEVALSRSRFILN
jgi:hypothetical protein